MKIKEYLHKYYNKYFDKFIVNNHEITKVTDFSKDVSKNTCFVNLKDSTDDKYINEAIKLGAKTIITSLNFNKEIKEKINIIKVESPKVELARLLKCLYFNKYHKMPITIGVSGTCGKTTVTSLLYETLKNLNKDVLLIGSNGVKSFYGLKETSFITSNTTPSITKIYKYLMMNEMNYDYFVLEVSSQGICESRVLGLEFDYSLITNFNKEHLEYHKTYEDYLNSKGRLLLNTKNATVLYKDMEEFDYFYKLSDIKKLTYGYNNANVNIKVLNSTLDETIFIIKYEGNEYLIKTKLISKYNILNITAVFSMLVTLDIPINDIIYVLNKLSQVEGRMNVFEKNGVKIIVDYAHSTLATKEVLEYLNNIKKERIISVFGVGGNRDKEKRGSLGSLVCEYSDIVIFTEDNSRDENVIDIINDLTKDVKKKNFIIETNRKNAIELALNASYKGDIVVILGKGNENKIIGKEVREFSDLKYVMEYVNKYE